MASGASGRVLQLGRQVIWLGIGLSVRRMGADDETARVYNDRKVAYAARLEHLLANNAKVRPTLWRMLRQTGYSMIQDSSNQFGAAQHAQRINVACKH
jgi:hypothetical protein